MDEPAFSWLKAIPALRSALSDDADRGLAALREHLRAQPIQGFEVELVGRLLRDLRHEEVTTFPVDRVAVLASYTSEPIANAARVALLRDGVVANVYEAPFGSYQQEILAPEGGLYAFAADTVIIAVAPMLGDSLPQADLSNEGVESALLREVDSWRGLWGMLAKRVGKPVLQHLYESPEEELLGIAERRAAWTASRFVETLNRRLLDAAPSFVRWIDVDRLAARVGRQNWRDLRLHHHAKYGFSPRFLPEYAQLLASVMRSARGTTKKALILDLDNTLWGGVIGDDRLDGIRLGPDTAEGAAYAAFCGYVKDLGQRGVILGICSKNDLTTAAEVFEKHPHMPLALDDFAVTICSWDDKATNLVRIARQLNVDLSSLVLVDDNPAECELIRQALPEVHTVLMDGDPVLFVRRLDHQHLFDAQSFSREDLQRSESYQAKAKSMALHDAAPDLDSYLASLDMRAQLRAAEPGDLARLAQMEMKTNQFNLTTRRLGLEQLEAMLRARDTLVLAVSLVDRFADHGLVSYVAATASGDTLRITDWLMSCRVFSRTLEQSVFNHLVQHALERNVDTIEAVFRPTTKNAVMEGLFERFGFVPAGAAPEGPWRYDVAADRPLLKCFVADASLVAGPSGDSIR